MHKIIHLLDIKGLALNSAYSTPNTGILANGEKDKTINHENGLSAIFDKFISPILEAYQSAPRDMIAVWDAGNEYRKNLYTDYKKRRTDAHDKEEEGIKEDKEKYLARVEKFLTSIGVTQVRLEGQEADDLVAYLAIKLSKQCPIVVHSIDNDLIACRTLGDTISVSINGDSEKAFKGLPDNLVTVYKSLVGDTSDGYPGVQGFGPKAWEKLASTYGLDGMEQLDAIVRTRDWDTLKQAAKATEDEWLSTLLTQKAEWELQYLLAKLHPELAEGVKGSKTVELEWTKQVPSFGTLSEALRNLSNSKQLREKVSKFIALPKLVGMADAKEVLADFKSTLEETPFIAFDYESTDKLKHKAFLEAKRSGGEFVDVLSQEITGMSFTWGANHEKVAYVTVDHKDSDNAPLSYIRWILQTAIAAGKPLVAHNAAFEYLVTLINGVLEEIPTIYDTKLMASACWEDEQLGLKSQSKGHLGFYQSSYEDTLKSAGAEDMAGCKASQVLSYGTEDSLATAHLFDLMWFVQALEGTWEFTRDRDFEFVHEQARQFLSGINFDVERMQVLAKRDAESKEMADAELRELLEKNCQTPSAERATELFQDQWLMEEKKLLKDRNLNELDEEEKKGLADKMKVFWEKTFANSAYTTKQVKVTPADFKPTATMLAKITDRLGFTKIEKVTKKDLMEWCAINNDTIVDADLKQVPNLTEMARFFEMVGTHSNAILKREGAAYDQFVAWCKGFLGIQDKEEVVGSDLNIGSPQQMQAFLYSMLGLPIRVRSKVAHGSTREKFGLSGSPSTDADAIAMAFAEDITSEDDWRHAALSNYRTIKRCTTAQSLFYRPYPLWVHPADGCIHGSIINDGTVTRRPTSSSPNLLQLTKNDGGAFRSCVRPRLDDHVIISADFNGQEIRLTASESKDPAMLDAYLSEDRKDIHSVTASAIFMDVVRTRYPEMLGKLGVSSVDYYSYLGLLNGEDVEVAKLAKLARKMAKALNFLMIYGGGHTTLARRLMIPAEQAKMFMNATFAKYSRLQPWQQETIEFAKRNGYTQTAYGNRRHIGNGIFSKDDGVRMRNERQAINYTIQGCAADILKVTMSEAYRRKLFTMTDSYMIAPVYDELASSVPRAAAYDYCCMLKEIMSVTPPGHTVPMSADFSVSSDSWGRQIEIGGSFTKEQVEEALEKSKELVQVSEPEETIIDDIDEEVTE
jgi:DNA polymerase-1